MTSPGNCCNLTSPHLKAEICCSNDEVAIHPELREFTGSRKRKFSQELRTISPDTVVMVNQFDKPGTDQLSSEIKSWESMFAYLKDFGEVNGHYDVPWNYKFSLPDGTIINLGKWLGKQRELRNKGTLRKDRYSMLQNLFDFTDHRVIADDEKDWEMMFDMLLCYGAQNNNDHNVPFDYEFKLPDDSSLKLGVWLQLQINNRKKLSESRSLKIQELIESGNLNGDGAGQADEFVRPVKILTNTTNGDRHNQTTSKTISGNCNSSIINNYDFANWNTMFNILSMYATCEGHCNVPSKYEYQVGDGTILRVGAWFSQQKHLKRKGRLLPERDFKLNYLINMIAKERVNNLHSY